MEYMLGNQDTEAKYSAHNQSRFNLAFSKIDQIIKNRPKISILDIGTSPLTFMLKKRYPKASIWTIDYSNKFMVRCKKGGINFSVVDLNIAKFKYRSPKFEIITFLEVLEHLTGNHVEIVRRISSLLTKGGVCILQTPNKFSPKAMFVKMVSESVWEKFSNVSLGKDEFSHHKEYSLSELSNMIRKIKGVEIISAEQSMYFDEIASALVYQKYSLLFTPLVYLNYLLVKLFPFLRRGLMLIFRRI